VPASLPRLVFVLTLAAASGCDGEPTAASPAEPPTPPTTATAFDPANCSRITGRVTWAGPIPPELPFLYGIPQKDGTFDVRMMPNPNRPAIDPETRAVAGAVVFLRGVNPATAKPWDLPPVRVEGADRQLVIRQGDSEPRRVGFVRRGDAVTLASAEPVFHVIRGRGAAFFSYAFPEPGKPLTRPLDRPGRVELSSGAGYYWARADLFVDDHPYYTLTDRDGGFALELVPAGAAELVVWLPGWLPARQERDPESGLIARQTYSPPVEVRTSVTVVPGQAATASLTVP
jgi:hypothetical protein